MKYRLIDKTGGKVAEILNREIGDIFVRIWKGTGYLKDGDALVARDELLKAGLQWGKDFYLKKME